jgi:hypothetical protein
VQTVSHSAGNVPAQFLTLGVDRFSPVASQNWQPVG